MFKSKKASKGKSKDTQKENEPTSKNSGKSVSIVRERNDLAYGLAKKSLTVSLASSTLGILVIIAGSIAIITKPDTMYFAVDPEGKIIQVDPVNHPMLTNTELNNWIARSVSEALSMDFINLSDDLAASQELFTPDGFDAFIRALDDSGNLDSIRHNRYVVTSNVTGAPVIINEGERGGRYMWQVRVPVAVTYHAGSSTRSQTFDVVALVVRVDPSINKNGVAFHQIRFSR